MFRASRLYFVVCALVLSGCFPVGESVPAGGPYVLQSEPWSQYSGDSAKVYILPPLSPRAAELLLEQQLLVSGAVTSSGRVEDWPEFPTLNERLSALKLVAPQLALRSGESNASISPDLIAGVEGLIRGVNFGNLRQRTDAMNRLIAEWSKRTSQLGSNASESVTKTANLAYLESLTRYASDISMLEIQVRLMQESIEGNMSNGPKSLADWSTLETDELTELAGYIKVNHKHVIEPVGPGEYMLPEHRSTDHLLLGCEIEGRMVYFNLEDAGWIHPFRLQAPK